MIVPRGSSVGLFPPKRHTGRRRGFGWRPAPGLRSVSPVGFADFASFQNAVTASYPACPPPYDPACVGPRSAAISADLNAWITDPNSCHNVVCNSSGVPAASMPAAPAAAATAGSLVSPVFHPGTVLTPRPRPVPSPVAIQSNSAANAPGGSNASPGAPAVIQTQTPPLSSSACASTQTYIPPGGMFTSGPMTGQVTSTGACQDNAPSIGDFLSQIPAWGWGVALISALVIFRGGKR